MSSDKALYSLLLTEALYKTGVDETDDSLISIATNYYNLKDKNPLRTKAYYLKGIIQANGNDYSDALLSFMLAEETANITEDIKQIALIHRAMGDAFEKMRNSKTSVSYYQKSYDEFKSINDSTYTAWALYDLARAYYNSAQYEKCVKIAKDCLYSSEKSDDDNLKACTLSLLGGAYELNNNNEDAIYYLHHLHREYPSYMSAKDWNSLGTAYLYSGNIQKAKECEDSIKKMTSEHTWLSYLTAYYIKDYKTALELLRSEYRDACNTSIENVSRTTEKNLLDRYRLIRNISNKEKKLRTLGLSSIILSLSILMLCVILFFRKRNNKLRQKVACLSLSNDELIEMKSDLENKINTNNLTILSIKKKITSQEEKLTEYQSRLFSISQDCKNLENQLDIQNVANKELLSRIDKYSNTIKEKDEINALLTSSLKAANSTLSESRDSMEDSRLKLKNTVASRYEMLDRISKTYYEMGEVTMPKNKLLKTLVSIIDDIRFANNGLKEMEDFVNLNLDNLIQKFKKDFPTLKDYEYNLYIFLILGFSFKSISIFQDVSLENLYNRKSSLIKKINSNPSTAIDYLYYLR